MYARGQGVKQDYPQAVRWFRPAAEQGNAEAQEQLGFMYDAGRGVAKDRVEGLKWLRLAAERGNAEAQRELGFRYYIGVDVKQDYAQAALWTLPLTKIDPLLLTKSEPPEAAGFTVVSSS